MVKRFFQILAVIGLMAAAFGVTHAQQQNEAGLSRVLGWADLPVQNATVARADLYVAGWVFGCDRGGQQPYNVKVWFFYPGTQPGIAIPVKRHSPLYRPDVRAAFAPFCEGVSNYTGYGLFPVDPLSLPIGRGQLVIQWSDAFGSHYDQIPITITP